MNIFLVMHLHFINFQELVTDQAVRHLKQYTTLFAAFTQTARSELSLLLKVQEYCYSNMTFMRAFQKIITLFYKTDVISEQVFVIKLL